jgi:uncharacterized paraquat-inducible protein A
MIVLVAYALGYVALSVLLAIALTAPQRRTDHLVRVLRLIADDKHPRDVRRCAACHLALDPTDGPTCHVCDVHAYQAWVQSLPVTEPTR